MAFTLKYSKTDYLKMVHTGNTLGIGVGISNPTTFISLDTLVNANTTVGVSTNPTTFAGNTLDWHKGGSWALLNPSPSDVPAGSKIDFAALIWVTSGAVTTTTFNTTQVTFGLPDGTTVPLSIDPAYSADGTNNLKSFMTRGREVTSLLQGLPNSGFGNYSVSNIPFDTSNFGVGWGLVLVYKNPAMPLRNVSINTGFLVNGDVTTVSGFYTPVTGTVQARAFVMGQYGFSQLLGDTFTLNGVNLSGPRNPATNFFTAQICDYQGNLLTTSSFGDRNSTPGSVPSNPKGDRVDIDLTNVSASGVLGNAKRSASIAIAGNGDIVSANAIGLEVNANAPMMGLTKTALPTDAAAGDTVTYTVVIKNTGSTTADNVIFIDTIPSGTTFINDTITINGAAAPTGSNPQTGFSLSSIPAPTGVSTVTFKVKLNSSGFVGGQTIPNTSFVGYNFINDPSVAALTGTAESNVAIVTVTVPKVSISKQVNLNYATAGDTIQYTLVINNTPNSSPVTNITLFDTIPTGLSFVSGSVIVNGVSVAGDPTPPTGITLPDVPGNGLTTVTFNVLVNSVPNVNEATNSGVMTVTQDSTTFAKVSNAVVTTISFSSLSSSKTADKAFGNVGDTITYTIAIKNTSNTTANNVTFIDTIPNGTTLITGTFKQDGTAIAGSPNPPGVTLSSIGINATSTIVFSVRVNSIPSPNPIPNTSAISYAYTVDPSTPNGKTGTTQSNLVTTQINNASIPSPTKVVDKAFAKVGDTLLYTIILQNTGNTSATNVILKDTIPNNTTFEANSVTINGVTQLGAVVAPPTGLSVGTIPGGSVTTVTFIVTVSTIPTPNPIPNTATTTYSYTVDTSLGTTVTESSKTNTVTTQVNTAIVGTTKTVSAANVFVGDTVTYTMVLRNTGNTTANSVLLTDTIPNGGTFVADSVTVNGTTQTGINPQTNGVVVPTLPVGGVATVTFKVILDTIPVPNPTPNTGVTNYSYLLDSSTPTNQSAAGSSNTVTTFVNPNSNPLKVVDKTSGTVGDTLTYFIQWANVTNTTETDVIFVDTLPNGVTFVPNSVTINGVSQPGFTITPPNGINTGTLPLDGTVSITYKVIVNTMPVPNPIPNTASVTNTGGSGTQTQESNQVSTQVNFAEITQAPKTVDKVFNTVGETMTYTIVLFNNGNTSANNVVVLDTIPNGTTFVVNSVSVNGVNQPGAVVAPTTGLTLSCIPAGTAATITFQVLVQSIPVPNPTPNTASASYTYTVDNATGQTKSGNINTNTVTTTIVDATIVSTKVVNKSFAQVGDTLTYTIVLVATGNTTANNAVFIDSLPSTLTYVPGTFAINGGIVAGANPAPPGQSIGSLTIPATYTITFNAVVNTIPTTNTIQNQAQTNYAYTVEPTIANSRTRGSATNIANTTVSQASLGGITKATDKLFADCGETVTYTVVIPNSGNVTATNVVFRDTIPSGTILVANSVTVNGTTQTGASPQTGINLGTIAPGSVTTVVFKVTVQC